MTTATRFAWRSHPWRQLLPALLFGMTPLASWGQLNDALADPAFVRRHQLRTATLYSEYQGRVSKERVIRFDRAGRSQDAPPKPRPVPASRWREEQVCDAQDRTVAEKHYRGDTLQFIAYHVYGPNRWPLLNYVYHPARPGRPASYLLSGISTYDYFGNAIETTILEASMIGGFLRFGPRYHSSYDAQHRLTSTTSFEQLFSPERTDSIYRDAHGQVLRQVNYVHNHHAGWPMCENLTLYQYNARGQETRRLGIGYEGRFQDVRTQRYRPDGQPLQLVYYQAARLPQVPWTEAVRRSGRILQLGEGFEHSQTDYRYDRHGLLTAVVNRVRRSPEYGQPAVDQTTRYRWRYTYYR